MTDERSPIILWFRRDLRLSDHPALSSAIQSGRPIIPVFILDELAEGLGAAPKWRLSLGLDAFSEALSQTGSSLILRRGQALETLRNLVAETGAGSVFWSRAYDPEAIKRDKHIKAQLTAGGVEAKSFSGHLLFEPWTVETKSGQPFRVFTPMWRAVQNRAVPTPEPAPNQLIPPSIWPASEDLASWKLGAAMNRGAEVVRPFVQPGEKAAHDHLFSFLDRVANYPDQRDQMAENATSNLSEYLSLGEIGPRTIWHVVQNAGQTGASGTEAFLRQLVWREFAYHLMFHFSHLLTRNWREEWDGFPWNTDPELPEVVAWKQARTGIPVVDAGLREMYVTGRMHNRARMVVASYLTKHLMTHWKIGMDWFADCLIDWDPAANAMGWQWVAGSGPDAAPFFRIFNPQTQQEKFDPNSSYLRQWVAEGQSDPSATSLAYFNAVPRSWGLDAGDIYPQPIVGLKAGRNRALTAYETRKSPVRN
ncbi:deoxyribodipyrimidine photo-lyase [Roseibium sp. RKSG952]|uniref:cryptochrome/photolyase family protein n=1 Tax=Roseibium sp. RKSG952 TaxID=2529384 RepID=UPI0012BCC3F8|nr:deoxyribodipyrimidine photo-lyase [Roseibium sp. RKSG952]MTH99638.1 deoxyribodipyrimidine photo-lyase [Roseibium sp. RKSG952]